MKRKDPSAAKASGMTVLLRGTCSALLALALGTATASAQAIQISMGTDVNQFDGDPTPTSFLFGFEVFGPGITGVTVTPPGLSAITLMLFEDLFATGGDSPRWWSYKRPSHPKEITCSSSMGAHFRRCCHTYRLLSPLASLTSSRRPIRARRFRLRPSLGRSAPVAAPTDLLSTWSYYRRGKKSSLTRPRWRMERGCSAT